MRVLAIRDAERRNLVQGKGSYSDRKRALKWVLLVTVPRTVLDDATRLRTASVRQDHRKYCVLVLRTHPVGSVVMGFEHQLSGLISIRSGEPFNSQRKEIVCP